MQYKKYIVVSLFIFFSIKVFPAVFVVTSNADAGPGTLRDALTQAAANGSTTIDYITFNLPDLSTTGRTITIVTSLPDVSSNLVIDGTTQPGVLFGKSKAAIEISTTQNYNPYTIFHGTGLRNIAFYGLYLHDYYDIITSYPGLQPHIALQLISCSNIVFGAPSKGNLVRGFNTYSLDIEKTDSLTLQSNIIGLGASNTIGNDGNGYTAGYTGFIHLDQCNHIALGGDSTEGNIIFTMLDLYFYQQTTSSVVIGSNNFEVYQDGVNTEWYFEFYRTAVLVKTDYSNTIMNTAQALVAEPTVNMDIYNNLSGSQSSIFGFQFVTGTVNFTGNYFNVARDGLTPVKYLTQTTPPQNPINIQNSYAQFNIGTNDISKKNYFNDIGYGVSVQSDPNIFIRYNDFKCVANTAYVNNYNGGYTLPSVSISGVNANGNTTAVTGTATPNSTIDIYSSESCQSQCSIRSYIQTVTADNTGNWQANILNLNGIFYVSATLNNHTSLFETFQVNSDHVNIQQMRCTNTASITGLTVPQNVSYYWTDAKGNVVSTDINLTTQTPGKYRVVLAGGCITSQWFEVDDDRVVLYDAGLTKTNISCGLNNGAISGLFVFDPLTKISSEVWTDSKGTVVGSSANISNLAAGSYTMTVKTSDGCSSTYGPVVLKNTTGPNIDQSKAVIGSTNCGQSAGSITGITATGTGTITYSWKNATQQQVGTTPDLTGQPAGQYTLAVSDNTPCGPVYTTAISIPETNGITLDESNVRTTIASCMGNNGMITGLLAGGATAYQWTDANNNLVANSLDLSHAVPGDYSLTASNNFGCTKRSKIYHIGQIPLTVYPVYSVQIQNTCFGQVNGTISLTTDALVRSARWVSNQGQTLGAGNQLTSIAAGSYQLYLTDNNGCESFYANYTVAENPPLQIAGNSVKIVADECNLKTGSISGLELTGGFPPYSYSWTNAAGGIISTTSELSGLGAGIYTLRTQDARNCGAITLSYTIQNQDHAIPAPQTNNAQICGPGNALIQVRNPVPANLYKLYTSLNGVNPADTNGHGVFKVAVKQNTTFYVSQASGSCESPRNPVQVSVGIAASDIPNAITPNGDGTNDYWVIPGIENYPAALIQIFNRNGQKVFESNGYALPFDGTMNGQKLSPGTYYYLINLSNTCSLLSGSVSIVR